jgi:hypothetical protein
MIYPQTPTTVYQALASRVAKSSGLPIGIGRELSIRNGGLTGETQPNFSKRLADIHTQVM